MHSTFSIETPLTAEAASSESGAPEVAPTLPERLGLWAQVIALARYLAKNRSATPTPSAWPPTLILSLCSPSSCSCSPSVAKSLPLQRQLETRRRRRCCKSFLPTGQDFAMRNMQLPRSPIRISRNADLLRLHAPRHLNRRLPPPQGRSQSMSGESKANRSYLRNQLVSTRRSPSLSEPSPSCPSPLPPGKKPS